MIKLLDGRSHFYQWDTGRSVIVDDRCKIVNFRNNLTEPVPDILVYEKDGLHLADVPEELLQECKDITVYAHILDDKGVYTSESETFKVTPRNKPAGYVYTPTEIITIGELKAEIESLKNNFIPY